MERFENFYEDWIDGEDEDMEPTQEFTIKDASTADWAIQKIADERKKAAYFKDCAQKEIDKLKAQITEMENKTERATQYLSGKLMQYIEQEDVPTKKTKTQISIVLPAGKIIKKLPAIEYVSQGGEKLTNFKKDNGFIQEIKSIDANFIKVTEEVAWGDLKKELTSTEDGTVMLKDSGEIIESLKATETLPSIKIEPNED